MRMGGILRHLTTMFDASLFCLILLTCYLFFIQPSIFYLGNYFHCSTRAPERSASNNVQAEPRCEGECKEDEN